MEPPTDYSKMLAAMPSDETSALEQLLADPEGVTALTDGPCGQLALKGLVESDHTNRWRLTSLGRSAIRRSRAHDAPFDWASFHRFLAGGEGHILTSAQSVVETTTERATVATDGIALVSLCNGDLGDGGCASEPSAEDRHLPVQENRRENLARVLNELGGHELSTLIATARLLGVTRLVLHEALAGLGLGDAEAREIEWAMNRPLGWLDQDHQGTPD